MQLYESDLFKNAKAALESSFGVRQVFDVLPPGTEILVTLDDRIKCTLLMTPKGVAFEPRETQTADLHLVLFAESIRRFKTRDYDDPLSIVKEILTQFISGYAKIHVLTSPLELKRKGYLKAAQKLGPEFQKTVMKFGFSLMGHAHSAFESLKKILKV